MNWLPGEVVNLERMRLPCSTASTWVWFPVLCLQTQKAGKRSLCLVIWDSSWRRHGMKDALQLGGLGSLDTNPSSTQPCWLGRLKEPAVKDSLMFFPLSAVLVPS